jgi:peroxidase
MAPRVVVAALLLIVCGAAAAASADVGQPPVAPGLSFDFYKRSCPRAEAVVRSFVREAVRRDAGLAAGLLRLHFHDCFVQGCDASVLLEGSATGPGEKQAPPNLRLRPSALKAINDIHDRLNRECGGAVVSCSDVLALAARDSVVVVIDLPLTPLAVLLFCSLY